MHPDSYVGGSITTSRPGVPAPPSTIYVVKTTGGERLLLTPDRVGPWLETATLNGSVVVEAVECWRFTHAGWELKS